MDVEEALKQFRRARGAGDGEFGRAGEPPRLEQRKEIRDVVEVVVGIADDGSGIPEGIRDKLFEMGAKGPDSEGTGFGLGFVRALTESYGGSVGVHESSAGGADFRVRLERA